MYWEFLSWISVQCCQILFLHQFNLLFVFFSDFERTQGCSGGRGGLGGEPSRPPPQGRHLGLHLCSRKGRRNYTMPPQQRASTVGLASRLMELQRVRFQHLRLDKVVRKSHPGWYGKMCGFLLCFWKCTPRQPWPAPQDCMRSQLLEALHSDWESGKTHCLLRNTGK